jgi:hypothetical protein
MEGGQDQGGADQVRKTLRFSPGVCTAGQGAEPLGHARPGDEAGGQNKRTDGAIVRLDLSSLVALPLLLEPLPLSSPALPLHGARSCAAATLVFLAVHLPHHNLVVSSGEGGRCPTTSIWRRIGRWRRRRATREAKGRARQGARAQRPLARAPRAAWGSRKGSLASLRKCTLPPSLACLGGLLVASCAMLPPSVTLTLLAWRWRGAAATTCKGVQRPWPAPAATTKGRWPPAKRKSIKTAMQHTHARSGTRSRAPLRTCTRARFAGAALKSTCCGETGCRRAAAVGSAAPG